MEAWQILLIVFGSILVLYVLLLITDLIFVFSFKTILKKHNKSLSVVLNAKYDNLKKVIAICEKANIDLDMDLIKEFDKLNPRDFAKQYTLECHHARDILSQLRNNIYFALSTHPDLEKHYDFQVARDNIIELDDVYRINIAMYNADVLGYNYWIRFLPCRYIFLIFKTQKKDLIS